MRIHSPNSDAKSLTRHARFACLSLTTTTHQKDETTVELCKSGSNKTCLKKEFFFQRPATRPPYSSFLVSGAPWPMATWEAARARDEGNSEKDETRKNVSQHVRTLLGWLFFSQKYCFVVSVTKLRTKKKQVQIDLLNLLFAHVQNHRPWLAVSITATRMPSGPTVRPALAE